MAVLQTIRNRGILLVSVIALALFLFVIGDFLRGGEVLFQQAKMNVGEINGEKISIQEYQDLTKEYQNFYEVMSQKSSFSEQELNQLNDQAWDSYIQNKLIQKECEELGIAATDDEVSEILKNGQSQFLQTPIFMNQQGRYDYANVQAFLNAYNEAKTNGQVPQEYEKVYSYYMYVQKAIRSQIIMQKYQALLAGSFLSNPLEAKVSFEGRSNQTDILLAAVPMSSVADKDVNVTDEEIKNKYNEQKEKFALNQETRDVKVINVVVTPSAEDKAETEKDMNEYTNKLAAAQDAAATAEAVRASASLLPYYNVYKTKEAFTLTSGNFRFSAISNLLDSAAVGSVSKPVYDAASNVYYSVKVLDKATKADSVLFRQITVVGKDEADSATKADSILNAIKGGAAFKDIAKKYAQPGDSAWITSAQFANAQLDDDNVTLINTLYGMSKGETKKVKFANGVNLIVQVMDQKDFKTMYNVASVVKTLEFSNETFNNEYNKFASFVSANQNAKDLEENAAKKGYTVLPIDDLSSAQHNIYGIKGTHEALRWVFENAEIGNVSEIYDCGDHNNLMVVALTGINEKGYYSLDKVNIKEYVKQLIVNDKKAEKIIESAKNVKDFASAAKVANAVTDTVRNITFAAPTFVRSINASESVLSAAAAKSDNGKFVGPVKGIYGVYMFQVINKNKSAEKFDAKSEQASAAQYIARSAFSGILPVLTKKANITDTRYKFF